MITKIAAYINFAIRKGDCVFGTDKLALTDKAVYIILVCNTTGESTVKKAVKLANKFDCDIYRVDGLGEYTHRATKVIGISDKELARAIQIQGTEVFINLRRLNQIDG
ncbi:MAG: hypothetical protein PHX51_03105 [Clostridia bacterium]|nr:hypothetical protein [Clostridia bacterium]